MSCTVCTVHRPDADGWCTLACHHPAPEVGHLCTVCLRELRTGLDTLDHVRVWLDAGTPAGHRGDTGGTPTRTQPLPGGTGRMSWIEGSELRRWLTNWCLLAAEETGDTAPAALEPAMTVWLRARIERHIAHTDWVPTFAAELAAWAARGAALAGFTDSAGVRIGCPDCATPIWVDLASAAAVTCGGCHARWSPDRVTHRAITHQDTWLAADDIEHLLGVPARTVRHWARNGRIRKRGSLYAVADIRNHREGAS